MIKLGERQALEIVKENVDGFVLTDADATGNVFLPEKEMPENKLPGDVLEVFVYKDNKQNFMASLQMPKVEMGGIAVLRVKSATDIGAFLDWGLDKDLFLPFKEQRGTVKEGQRVLIQLYEDKSGRLCATMRISRHLKEEGPFEVGDSVWGTVYDVKPEMGLFVAVENRFHGMVPAREVCRVYEPGEKIVAWVHSIRPDKKLNLSLRDKAYKTRDEDSERILKELESRGGYLPFNDASDALRIRRHFGFSKRSFKRALGKLLKEGLVLQESEGIRLKDEKDFE